MSIEEHMVQAEILHPQMKSTRKENDNWTSNLRQWCKQSNLEPLGS